MTAVCFSVSVDGVVEEINIYYTTIKTFDAKVVSIPNGTVSGSAIVNNFTSDTRRVDLTFSAAYSSDIDLVKRVLIETALSNPRVLKDPEPKAVLSEHADSALKFTLRVWVKVPDYLDVQFELKESVKKAFDAAGIEIPFPQIDVHNR
ncbi:MAG: mechanosensitive ion channel [Clostridia bacterium]|nr:mechanosensitive ion channel [Clostridia bacterium]